MELDDIISKYPPKQMMLIPIIVIILALISLGVTYLNTGSPVNLGIEFTGGTLASDEEYTELAQQIVTKYGDDAEIRHMGPIYSQELQAQVIRYLPLSFILMALVVFIVFRQVVVSLLVVLCALADILTAAASMNLTGVQLSLGTVAALLMLIGYSVDTDILLTMRVLKRKGDHGGNLSCRCDIAHFGLQPPSPRTALIQQNGCDSRYVDSAHLRPGSGSL